MSVENLLSSNNPNGNDGLVASQGIYEHPQTKEPTDFTYSYIESYVEGQIPRSEIRDIAAQTIDSVLQTGFLQRLNGRLVADGKLMTTAWEFVLKDETVILRSSQTPIGRELWIGASNGFISLSDKEIATVDVKKDGELFQSTDQSAKVVDLFLAEISEKIGDIDPQVPMTPQSESQVIRV